MEGSSGCRRRYTRAILRKGTELTWVLHFAAVGGHEDSESFNPARVEVYDADIAGFTALHPATDRGKTVVVEVLVKAGAKVDAQSDGWTRLHEAARERCSEAVVAPMKHGADHSKLEIEGQSPLHLAGKRKE